MEKVTNKGIKIDLHIHSIYSKNKDKEKVSNNTTIDKDTMEFNTTKFYDYVFSDIDKELDIKVNNTVSEFDKVGQRTYSTIVEICDGVIAKMKEKCFS